MRATYVPAVPQPYQFVGRDFWVDAAQKAVDAPDQAVLVGNMLRRSRIISARRIVRQFNESLTGGAVLVRQRNSTRGPDGEWYADLYFEYEDDEGISE